jgi:hypothetical protein
MKLEEYLRNDFAKYLKPLLIKNKCEFCNTTDNLQLHHDKQFAEILFETLKELNLINKDTELYTINELSLIRNIMLSKQIRIKYITLCDKCHQKIKTNRYKPDLIKTILKNNIDITNMTFNKCMNPDKAMENLKKEFLNNEITLEDLIIECMEIGYLHPNKYIKKVYGENVIDRINVMFEIDKYLK